MCIYWIKVLACIWGFVQGDIGINPPAMVVSFGLL